MASIGGTKQVESKGQGSYEDDETKAGVAQLLADGKDQKLKTAVIHQRLKQPIFQKRERSKEVLQFVCYDLATDCENFADSGASGIIATWQNKKLTLAAVGGCAAFLIMRINGQVVVVRLTAAHTIDNPNEKARLEAETKERPEGSLTRAFGNIAAQAKGVTGNPTLYSFDLLGVPGCEFQLLLMTGSVTEALTKASQVELLIREFSDYTLPQLAEKINLSASHSQKDVASLIVPLGEETSLFGVFEGFGPSGDQVAALLAKNTFRHLQKDKPGKGKKEEIKQDQSQEDKIFKGSQDYYLEGHSFVCNSTSKTIRTFELEEQQDFLASALAEYNLILEHSSARISIEELAENQFICRMIILCNASKYTKELSVLFHPKLEIIINNIGLGGDPKVRLHFVLDKSGAQKFLPLIKKDEKEEPRLGIFHAAPRICDEIIKRRRVLDDERYSEVIEYKSENACLTEKQIFALNEAIRSKLEKDRQVVSVEAFLAGLPKAAFFHYFSFLFQYNGIFNEISLPISNAIDKEIKRYLQKCFTPELPYGVRWLKVRKIIEFIQSNFDQIENSLLKVGNGRRRLNSALQLLLEEEFFLAFISPHLPKPGLFPLVIDVGGELRETKAYPNWFCTFGFFKCCVDRSYEQKEARAEQAMAVEFKAKVPSAIALQDTDSERPSSQSSRREMKLTIHVAEHDVLSKVSAVIATAPPEALSLSGPLAPVRKEQKYESLLDEYTDFDNVSDERRKEILEDKGTYQNLLLEIREVFGGRHFTVSEQYFRFLLFIPTKPFYDFLNKDTSRLTEFYAALKDTDQSEKAIEAFQGNPWLVRLPELPGMVTQAEASVNIGDSSSPAYVPS